MSVIERKLKDRSESKCEISGAELELVVYTLPPYTEGSLAHSVLLTKQLKDQVENPDTMNPNDWRGLSDSMWNENLPVQILSWRMLARLRNIDTLEMMYLEEEALEWAKATGEGEEEDENKIVHKDSNGAILKDGDSVVLIKDLDVKGATFTAKRGTAVHNIKVVWDDANLIEGRVENQHIYILTQYVKKTK